MPESANKSRLISDIAWEINRNWTNVYFSAAPYLDAMKQLSSLSDMYYADTAESIVSYFLANAAQWKGEKARTIKAELKAMLKAYRARF